jgi:hypothetical protein
VFDQGEVRVMRATVPEKAATAQPLSRVLTLPAGLPEAEQACRDAALDMGLRLQEAAGRHLVFHDRFDRYLFHVQIAVDLEDGQETVRAALSATATGGVFPAPVGRVEAVLSLYAALLEGSVAVVPETEVAASAALRRQAREILRLIPVIRWLLTAFLLAMVVVSMMFFQDHDDLFLLFAIIWVISGPRCVADVVRRRLAGGRRRTLWLSVAAEFGLLACIVAVGFLVF